MAPRRSTKISAAAAATCAEPGRESRRRWRGTTHVDFVSIIHTIERVYITVTSILINGTCLFTDRISDYYVA